MKRGEPNERKLIIFAIIVVALAAVVAVGLNSKLSVTFYTQSSDKISENVRIAFISDPHSCKYGEEQSELLNAVDEAKPDIIVFGGDIYDDIAPSRSADITTAALAEKYPCYYVTGNHEFWSARVAEIKKSLTESGVTVLEGSCASVEIRGQKLCICGIDDYALGVNKVKNQPEKLGGAMNNDEYTVLLAHHPEKIDEYAANGFALVLSGHAHGGFWRVFGLCGVYAPDQGWFPKYTSGAVGTDKTTMIISRGLARETTAPGFSTAPSS